MASNLDLLTANFFGQSTSVNVIRQWNPGSCQAEPVHISPGVDRMLCKMISPVDIRIIQYSRKHSFELLGTDGPEDLILRMGLYKANVEYPVIVTPDITEFWFGLVDPGSVDVEFTVVSDFTTKIWFAV